MIPMKLMLALAVSLGASAPAVAGPAPDPTAAQDPIRVVATLPVYAEIAREIGGDAVDVSAIADPAEDAHFVRPKPSYALRIRHADVFITTGLDLELWVPALLDKAGNPEVREGGRGHVVAYRGVELLDVPTRTDRSEGDIHIYGNPHLFTDPLNVITIAGNIAEGLKTAAPERAAEFDRRLASFVDRVHRRMYGDRLVEILKGPTLELLDRQGRLMGFLESQELEGRPLLDRLGGWHAAAATFRDGRVICYHKNWAYFENRFRVKCADYVEGKPGIPPTPGHVVELIDLMRSQQIGVLLAAGYFDASRVRAVANRGGATPVIVPLQPGGRGPATYFDLVDAWVDGLAAAFRDG